MTLKDPLVGRVVDGRYLVESRIARGGMATVYLALDHRLDREVALKVMHEHLAEDDGFVSRFVREARSAARLSHPNVVQVFDQGSDGTVLYLAMEYLPGRTLRDVLAQRGALTPRETVSVLEPILSALGAAHRAGIVHGDVKPENVILTDDGRIKVADFGLARAITSPIGSAATGELLGTVGYLAPEMVSGGIITVRADVYAAGIMLFELLTGKQPFTGSDPLQVASRHVHESVPAPTAIAPELPAAFDDVVLRATNRNPNLRPADADALLADIRAARAQVPNEMMDVRAADAVTMRIDVTQADVDELPTAQFAAVPGAVMRGPAPAPATGYQPTRVLEAPGRRATRTAAKGGSVAGSGGGSGMLPRLRVNDDDEAAPPGFFGDRRRQAIAAISGVIAVVLVIFGGVWWFTGGPGSFTTAPSVVGLGATDAEHQITAQGLKYTPKYAFNKKLAAGQVITTDPPGGGKVKKNGTITLTISKGPQLIVVPTLTGQSQANATGALKSAGLSLGHLSKKFNATVPAGQVVSSSPKAGTRIPPDQDVNLVISKGVQPVLLPNVVGQQIDAATQALQTAGFIVNSTPQAQVDGGPGPGTVVQQDPIASGQTLAKGSTVNLTVIQQPAQVNVPNVVGQNFDAAKQILQQAGFQVNKQGLPFANTVTQENPSGMAPAGATITLNVSF
jgi:beta-lactam-binding protein with PASTA domain